MLVFSDLYTSRKRRKQFVTTYEYDQNYLLLRRFPFSSLFPLFFLQIFLNSLSRGKSADRPKWLKMGKKSPENDKPEGTPRERAMETQISAP